MFGDHPLLVGRNDQHVGGAAGATDLRCIGCICRVVERDAEPGELGADAAAHFAGLINPVSSLEGAGRAIGEVYPATHMFTISRGVFNKALRFGDLGASFWPLLVAPPVIFGAAVALLRKQER